MANDNWQTPPEVFDPLMHIWRFENDAAASPDTTLLDRWYGPGGVFEDALAQPWEPLRHWCNPPYSRGMQRLFVERAIECATNGGSVVMLLPADTSTKLFHFIWRHPRCHVSFREGRIRFLGAPAAAKFGSMIVGIY